MMVESIVLESEYILSRIIKIFKYIQIFVMLCLVTAKQFFQTSPWFVVKETLLLTIIQIIANRKLNIITIVFNEEIREEEKNVDPDETYVKVNKKNSYQEK